MIGIYIGFTIFAIGSVITLLINRNVKAPIDGDFWDMPIRIKIGILFIVFGVLLAFISTMYMLIADPVGFLSQMN